MKYGPCTKIVVMVGLVAMLLLTVACPKGDAVYQTNRTITAISIANKGMTASVVKLNQIGLVSVPLARDILNYNRDVAEGVKSAEAILQSGKNWKEIAPEVLALLQKIHLPADVDKFVHDPATDAGLVALIATISTIQVLIEQSIVEVQK